MQRLIDAGWDLDEVDAMGHTPLHVAAGSEDRYSGLAVALLCQAMACVHMQATISLETALHRAANEGKSEAVAAILDALPALAARAGAPRAEGTVGEEQVGHAEAEAADAEGTHHFIDLLSAEGFTALHEACRNGHSACVKMLVERGANVNKSSAAGYVPLHVAVHNRHLECIQELVAAGADANRRDRDGLSPVDAADTEPLMRALSCWKAHLIMELLKEFVLRMQVRVGKETAMQLTGAAKTVGNERFKKLFVMSGFETFLDLSKYRDKNYAELRVRDLHDGTWECKRFGRYFNAARILNSNVARGGRTPSDAFLYVSAVAAEEHPDAADDDDAF